MNGRHRTDEKKIQTIESQIQTHTHGVLRFALLYTGSLSLARDLTVVAFAQTYRRMDLAHVYLTEKNAVYGGVVIACRAFDARLAGDTAEQEQSEELSVGKSATDVTTEDDLMREIGCATGDSVDAALFEVVGRLSPEHRMVVLLSWVAELGLPDISRILLLPKRVVMARLRLATQQLTGNLPSLDDGPGASMGLSRRIAESVTKVRADEALFIRIYKVVSATVQEVMAERRHRGPGWLKFATVAMGLISVVAVDVGFHAAKATQAPVSVSSTPPNAQSGLPAALSGLPVSTEFQYKLNTLPDVISLDHMAMAGSGIYLPTLEEPANSWPSIKVSYLPYTAKGQDFTSSLQPLSSIDLVYPVNQKSTNGTTSSDWKVINWRFDVTGNWAVAAVNWASGSATSMITQVYLLYLPSGQSTLALTLGSTGLSGNNPGAVVAAGDGRVVVQQVISGGSTSANNKTGNSPRGASNSTGGGSQTGAGSQTSAGPLTGNATLSNPSAGNTGSPAGLPVNMYQLTGTSPVQALRSKLNEVPALFGLMQDPSVLSSGVLFQGFAGQPADATDTNTTWYLMSWNGDLTQYVGPPVDRQHHFAVIGSNEDLWWAETTPNSATGTNAHWQVLMAPLTGDTAAQPAALNLNGPVEWFGAYNSHIAWVQDTDGQMQLVVATIK